jgi:hypothetical protein
MNSTVVCADVKQVTDIGFWSLNLDRLMGGWYNPARSINRTLTTEK